MSLVRIGSSMDRLTEGNAARWKTTSIPLVADDTVSGSRMSPRTHLMELRTGAKRLAMPVIRLSRTTTSSPRRTRAVARWCPINPAPPVTRTFTSAFQVEGEATFAPIARASGAAIDDAHDHDFPQDGRKGVAPQRIGRSTRLKQRPVPGRVLDSARRGRG